MKIDCVVPPAPLANSRVSARRSPGGGGGGDGRQVTVSRGGGGGDCKGISRQTVVPSTNASKENTCEATFALMPMCFIQHKCYWGSKGTVKNFWVRE